MLKPALLILFSLYSLTGWADWRVDPEGSHIGFASVKNDLLAENHSFTEISGSVTADGMASIEVKLSSVETLIPIRNERMQSMLFNIEKFPVAMVKSQVPVNELTSMAVGDSMTVKIDVVIDLHGTELKKNVPVKVTRAGDSGYDVTSLGPIIVHASQFALSEGVEALRKIAGLQSIDLMVPVTFDLRLVPAN